MPTKLSRFCDSLMEAGWLAAVVVIPLHFDVFSSRVFEPNKLALLRTIAVVVAIAWLVKVIEEGGIRGERVNLQSPIFLLRLPLIAPIAALVVSLLLSTLLSVTPRVSFFGSYQRLQGTYTALAYLTLFAAVMTNLRRREQYERLLSTIILASLPVSLYGWLQRWRIDPLPWAGDTVSRVSSAMGNPIFLGAYLIMVIPVTVGRVVESIRSLVADGNAADLVGLPTSQRLSDSASQRFGVSVIRRFSASVIYIFILFIQLITLGLTGSRGPWLGFLAGAFFLLILLSSAFRLRWLTIGTVGAAAALGVFLVALNIPNGPLEALRGTPGIGRLGHVFETDKETGRVRVLIWSGASQLIRPHPPLEYPDGHSDPFNFLRPLVGYGPESMYVAFNRFYPPELGQIEKRTATPDRSHNETWDALVTTGLIGLVVYLALFASIFYYGFKWLGLMETDQAGQSQALPLLSRRNLFLGLYVGGGLAGAVGLVLWQGLPFFGVGLPFGIMLGLIAYLTILALRPSPHFPPSSPYPPSPPEAGGEGGTRAPLPEAGRGVGGIRSEPWRTIALASLVAAIMAHFTEVHFGIAVAVSRTLFWVEVGLLVVIGLGWIGPDPSTDTPPLREKEASRRRRPGKSREPSSFRLQPSAFIVALPLALLGYNFINNPDRLTSAGTILWRSFTTLPTHDGRTAYGVLAIILITWLTGSLLFTSEEKRPPTTSAWLGNLAVQLGAALLVAFVYWFWQARELGRLAAFTPKTSDDLLAAVGRITALPSNIYLAIAVIIIALAIVLPDKWPAPLRRPDWMSTVLAGLLTVTTVIVSYTSNLRIVQADTIYKTGEAWSGAGDWPTATRLYLLASALAPNEDYYYLFVGRGFLEIADRATDPAEQKSVFDEAEKRLTAAQRLNPLNTDHTANLARLYRWWASVTTDAVEGVRRAQIADSYYERAISLSPNNATLWVEWASLHLAFLDDRTGALDRLNHALALDPKFDRAYNLLGDFHISLARETADEAVRASEYALAVESYRQAAEAEPEAFTPYIGLGAVYSSTGENRRAIHAYLTAVRLAPETANLSNLYWALAELYRRDGALADALNYAQLALANAPAEMKPGIQQLIDQLNAGG